MNGIKTMSGMKQQAIFSPTGQSLGSMINRMMTMAVGNEIAAKPFQ